MTGPRILLTDRQVVLSELPLKSSGEAAVYTVVGDDDIVVKLYRDTPGPEQERRLERMLTMTPPGGRPTDNHPFGGVPHDSDSQSTVKDNIAASCSYVVRPERIIRPGRLQPGCGPGDGTGVGSGAGSGTATTGREPGSRPRPTTCGPS